MNGIEKSVALIGIGNCGNQVVFLGEKNYGDLFDCVYINTSKEDLSQVKTLNENLIFKIGEEDEVSGSGKNRTKMKEYLRAEVKDILEDEFFQDAIFGKKYAYIIVSAAGGTGSGAGPVLFKLLEQTFPDTHFNLISVLPNMDSSEMELGNCLEFLKELYTKLDSPTYMIYDNESIADQQSSVIGLPIVNNAIIEDIRILTGIDNFPTPYESIDPADMESIATTPGRILVIRITKGITAKFMEDNDIGDVVIKAIKKSCHAETDRDKSVVRWGIITYFTEEVYKIYNPTAAISKISEFLGTASERFNHNAINDTGYEDRNFLYLIASGLSPIKDRKEKIDNKLRELAEEKEKIRIAKEKSEAIFSDADTGSSYNVVEERKKLERKANTKTSFKIADAFDDFM